MHTPMLPKDSRMTFRDATRLTVITETLNEPTILKMIEAHGATGYSVFNGGGKGTHGVHPPHRASVADGFAIVKIEAVVTERDQAEAIAREITETVFEHHAGIVYLDRVEILRKTKF